jgi:hypothetical protein
MGGKWFSTNLVGKAKRILLTLYWLKQNIYTLHHETGIFCAERHP